MFRSLLKLAGVLTLAVLAGCTTGSGAWLETLRAASAGEDSAAPRLDPRLTYLRLGNAGHHAYLALGYLDAHPGGEVYVWYSAAGEVIKLQNGRIVGTAGLPVDWREVRLPRLPAWQDIPAEGLRYQREIDRMPGYRYGRVQTLLLRPVPAVQNVTLRHAQPAQLRWFEEVELGDAAQRLPTARYAVDLSRLPGQVVYSEQCLSATLCFTFEPWPVAVDGGPATPEKEKS